MKRLLAATIPIMFFSACVTSDIASSMLYPVSTANSSKVPAIPPSPLQEIDIKTPTSETVGWYYEVSPTAPVLIYFHGNGDNIEALYEGGFLKTLASFNINFAVLDYPQYGLSTGELDQKGVTASGQNVIDFIKQKFPHSPIIIWGQSLGCAPAVQLANSNQDRVVKLILTSPWDEFWRVVQAKAGLDDASCKDAASGNEWLSDVASNTVYIPVLIHHGTKDTTVPYVLGQHLSQTFPNNSKNVTFISVDGKAHNDILTSEVLGQIYQFVHN